MEETIKDAHYTGSILYEIELTAKYCKMLSNQVFSGIHSNLNVEEFIVLDTLLCNKGICQRDLAKLILKDRANTGKLLDSLELKGLIERKLTNRNNRPVKIINLSKDGEKIVNEIFTLLNPQISIVREKIKNHDLAKVSNMLKELRVVLSDTLQIQI